MTAGEFFGFFNFLLAKMASWWNMFAGFSIGGIPWTRWLLLILGGSIIFGIVKHSISDAGGVTVSNSVTTVRKD